MHFNTCNKLIEKVNNLNREIKEIKDTLTGVRNKAALEAFSSCLRIQDELEKLKSAVIEARTK